MKSLFTMKRIEINQALINERTRFRASRTGGLSAAWHPFRGVTFNTQHGFRVSKTRKGLTAGFQQGNFVFRGRWNLGKQFRLNLSKTRGFSLSWKNSLGAFNLTRPQYSSAKFLGIHVRGKKAHDLQQMYAIFWLSWKAISLGFQLLIFALQLLLQFLHLILILSTWIGQLFFFIMQWIFFLASSVGAYTSIACEVIWLETLLICGALIDSLAGSKEQNKESEDSLP